MFPEADVLNGPNFKPRPFGGLNFFENPCSYFTAGKVKASTLSLTVLVIIEMLNAFNALSEDGSLLQMPPWTNPYLIIACTGSVLVHFVILYVPFLSKIFAVCALDGHDWVDGDGFLPPSHTHRRGAEVLRAAGHQEPHIKGFLRRFGAAGSLLILHVMLLLTRGSAGAGQSLWRVMYRCHGFKFVDAS